MVGDYFLRTNIRLADAQVYSTLVPYSSELYHHDLLYTPVGRNGINVGHRPQRDSCKPLERQHIPPHFRPS